MKREEIEEEIINTEKVLKNTYECLERWEKSENKDFKARSIMEMFSENAITYEKHLLRLRTYLALPDGYRQTES